VQRITGNRSVALQRRPGRGGTLVALAHTPSVLRGLAETSSMSTRDQKREYMKELQMKNLRLIAGPLITTALFVGCAVSSAPMRSRSGSTLQP
jgi:hypothetical protein